MAINAIRQWLLKDPAPSAIKCVCADGEVRMVKIDANSRKRFVLAEATIRDIRATQVEALDAKGNTIRLSQVDGVEVDPAPMPAPATPQGTDFQLYARLLADAYKAGADSTAKPTELAFNTLGQLLSLVMKRLDDMQAREVKQVNAALRAAQGEDVPAEDLPPWMQLVSQFMAGAQLGQATQPLPNGKAHEEAP